MNNKLDPRQILKHPMIYTTYQKLVGGYRARRLFVENHVKAKPGDKILDIGCGPGDILDFLQDVEYTGIDEDAHYISQAQHKYGQRGIFKCVGVDDLETITQQDFDIVITAGVLHHLNDAQCQKLFSIAVGGLKPKGRFVSFDGCYIPNQNKISKYFLDKDRGEFIRTPSEYTKLIKPYFSSVETTIDERYFYIPYTSIIMEGRL